MTGNRQHHPHRVLRRGDIVAGGSIDHHDATAGGSRNIDVIDPDACPTDHLEASTRLDHLGRDLRLAAHDQGIVLRDDTNQLLGFEPGPLVYLGVATQILDAVFSYWIGYKNSHKVSGARFWMSHRSSVISRSHPDRPTGPGLRGRGTRPLRSGGRQGSRLSTPGSRPADLGPGNIASAVYEGQGAAGAIGCRMTVISLSGAALRGSPR